MYLRRLGPPNKDTQAKLRKPISSSCHNAHATLIVHLKEATKGISPKKAICKLDNVNHIFHQCKFRLKVLNYIHENNQLLILLIIQRVLFVPKPVETTNALTRRSTTYYINVSLHDNSDNI